MDDPRLDNVASRHVFVGVSVGSVVAFLAAVAGLAKTIATEDDLAGLEQRLENRVAYMATRLDERLARIEARIDRLARKEN